MNNPSLEDQCQTGRHDLELVIEELQRLGRGKGDPVYDSAVRTLNDPAALLWWSQQLEEEAMGPPDAEPEDDGDDASDTDDDDSDDDESADYADGEALRIYEAPPASWQAWTLKSGPRKGQTVWKNAKTGAIRSKQPIARKSSTVDEVHSRINDHLLAPKSISVQTIHDLTDHIQTLTVKQIGELKRRLGIRAGGNKSVLAGKLAAQALKQTTTREKWQREARKAGIQPDELLSHAHEIRHVDRQMKEDIREAITAASNLYRHYSGTPLRRNHPAFREGDHSQLKRWDEVTNSIREMHPGLFDNDDDADHEQRLLDLVRVGIPPLKSWDGYYSAALDSIQSQPGYEPPDHASPAPRRRRTDDSWLDDMDAGSSLPFASEATPVRYALSPDQRYEELFRAWLELDDDDREAMAESVADMLTEMQPDPLGDGGDPAAARQLADQILASHPDDGDDTGEDSDYSRDDVPLTYAAIPVGAMHKHADGSYWRKVSARPAHWSIVRAPKGHPPAGDSEQVHQNHERLAGLSKETVSPAEAKRVTAQAEKEKRKTLGDVSLHESLLTELAGHHGAKGRDALSDPEHAADCLQRIAQRASHLVGGEDFSPVLTEVAGHVILDEGFQPRKLGFSGFDMAREGVSIDIKSSAHGTNYNGRPGKGFRYEDGQSKSARRSYLRSHPEEFGGNLCIVHGHGIYLQSGVPSEGTVSAGSRVAKSPAEVLKVCRQIAAIAAENANLPPGSKPKKLPAIPLLELHGYTDHDHTESRKKGTDTVSDTLALNADDIAGIRTRFSEAVDTMRNDPDFQAAVQAHLKQQAGDNLDDLYQEDPAGFAAHSKVVRNAFAFATEMGVDPETAITGLAKKHSLDPEAIRRMVA